MTRNAPSNTDDVIDSRDIIARIEELEELTRDQFPTVSTLRFVFGDEYANLNDRQREAIRHDASRIDSFVSTYAKNIGKGNLRKYADALMTVIGSGRNGSRMGPTPR